MEKIRYLLEPPMNPMLPQKQAVKMQWVRKTSREVRLRTPQRLHANPFLWKGDDTVWSAWRHAERSRNDFALGSSPGSNNGKADKPEKLRLGWVVYEEIGVGVMNPRAICKIVVSGKAAYTPWFLADTAGEPVYTPVS